MSALIVFLPQHAATASTEFEYVLTHDGSAIADHGAALATLLPATTRAGSEVVAIVPAALLSWHRVELPKGTAAGSPRMRAVLEGALEDQLLDEPEALHFALQPQARAGEPAWVATCDRAWLRAAVVALEAAERPAARIVPEFAPEGVTTFYAVGQADQPMVVVAGTEGVTAVPLSTQVLPLLPALADDTPCIAEPAVAEIAEQVLQRRPELRHPSGRWMRAAQSDWDLAQFEFSSSGRARAWKKMGTAWADILSAPQWKPARWGAVALVVINLLAMNAWAWRERSALDQKREAIRTTLTETFPQVKVVVDAPLQMQRELTALRLATGTSSGNDLESMLGALSAAAPAQRALTSIEYSNGELRVRGMALPAEEARTLASSLKAQGFTANTQGEALAITAGSAR
ncbi:general secretion pathway protein GspL [Caenimonas koreensis DSM 17982]|uniref:General secretion pathway protein GspL n=1 Tax=Caenimonas koreensis DSM 17982 TaxID=1121255 RepID=A0A844BBE1_9BURK|nr:type II secretion system protein GspL [Caenimonas koreensis]MRD48899.1 general secretion pathway protein GspL [Caenimonas koreensis DSM 17982]